MLSLITSVEDALLAYCIVTFACTILLGTLATQPELKWKLRVGIALLFQGVVTYMTLRWLPSQFEWTVIQDTISAMSAKNVLFYMTCLAGALSILSPFFAAEWIWSAWKYRRYVGRKHHSGPARWIMRS